jgi:hypothetical protein
MKYVITWIVLILTTSLTLALEISISTKVNDDPIYQRDVINGLQSSIEAAYASAYDTRWTGLAYISSKSSTEYTRAEREYCFMFVFDEIIRRCILTQGGQRELCRIRRKHCAVHYGPIEYYLSNPEN